jgi:alpha-L-rhamnosidase
MFDLLSEEQKGKAVEHLVNRIRDRENHISTGFLGTPYICHVLSDNGYTDVAYDLLLQETFPSWLYPVKMGATTIWERWDGIKPDSTFQNERMNSLNHYAYGAIGDWMYQVIAGINAGDPGYKHILINPQPDPRLEYAKARYESRYGRIESAWTLKDDKLIMNVTIPPNTTANITLPNATLSDVESKGQSLTEVFSDAVQIDENVVIPVGSGTYSFEIARDSELKKTEFTY